MLAFVSMFAAAIITQNLYDMTPSDEVVNQGPAQKDYDRRFERNYTEKVPLGLDEMYVLSSDGSRVRMRRTESDGIVEYAFEDTNVVYTATSEGPEGTVTEVCTNCYPGIYVDYGEACVLSATTNIETIVVLRDDGRSGDLRPNVTVWTTLDVKWFEKFCKYSGELGFHVVTNAIWRPQNYSIEKVEGDQDAKIYDGLMNGLDQEKYAELCYGSGASFQIRRALSERSESFQEPATWCAVRAKMDLRNMPCPPEETNSVPYRAWSARYGIFWNRRETVYPSGRMFYTTNAFEDLCKHLEKKLGHGITVPKATPGACREKDRNLASYALPPMGVAIHGPADVAEEVAHLFNFWFVETPAFGGCSTREMDYAATWNEFASAYHGLKVDAWEMGIDVGTEGGMHEYLDAIGRDAEGAFRRRIPKDSARLYDLWKEATSKIGGASDNAVYRRIRKWMDSPGVGRRVF